MPPSVDPRNQQVADAIVAALASIEAGDDYWYTPSKVIARPDFGRDCLADEFDGENTVIYVLSPDQGEIAKATTCHLDAVRRFDLAIAKRHTVPVTTFDQGDPDRTEIQARLAHDAQKKLLDGDQTLGIQGIWDINIPVDERSADLTWEPDWAIVYQRIVVNDHYQRASP